MKKPIVVCFVCVSLLSVSACSHMSQEAQRAFSGGAIGGAIGAAGGAAVTALAGAAIGALTTPQQVSLDKKH